MTVNTLSSSLAELLQVVRSDVGPILAPASMEVPSHLRMLRGTIAQRPVTMRVERRCGDAWASLLTADILDSHGQTLSATVIGLPDPRSCNPVLGVDLIALGGRLSLFAVDLAPIDDGWWQNRGEPALDRLRAAIPESFQPRPLPDFAVDTFSPKALIGRVDDDDALVALEATRRWLRTLPAHFDRGAGPPNPLRSRRLGAWVRAERQNRKEHAALARIFGPQVAVELSNTVLFPEELASA